MAGYLGVYSRLSNGVYTNHSDPVAGDNLVCEVLTTVQLHVTREFPLWYSIRALLELQSLRREREDTFNISCCG